MTATFSLFLDLLNAGKCRKALTSHLVVETLLAKGNKGININSWGEKISKKT